MILKICNLSFVCSIRLHSLRLHSIRLQSIRLHYIRLHSIRLQSLFASLHSAPLVFFSLSPPQHSASCKLRFDCDLQMAKLNKLAEPCLGEEKTVIKLWTVIKCFVNYTANVKRFSPSKLAQCASIAKRCSNGLSIHALPRGLSILPLYKPKLAFCCCWCCCFLRRCVACTKPFLQLFGSAVLFPSKTHILSTVLLISTSL